MSGEPDRSIPAAVAREIRRVSDLRRPYWNAFGPVVDVTFRAAATDRDVVHGLQQRPTGFHVVYADGPVYARPGAEWATKELAWLRASNANTHARVIFFTLIGDRDEA